MFIHTRRWRSVGPSTKYVQYHRMAPRVRASHLVEDQAAVCSNFVFCIFFSLPSLVSVSPSSFRLLCSRLVCPYPQVRHGCRIWLPLEERGGGSRAQFRWYPRPARGDGGMWLVGQGREPWERSLASGVNDNEWHLHHSPVSSPTEELW